MPGLAARGGAGTDPSPEALLVELHRLFGFRAFRPGQEELVRRALAGRDCLAVMPTGSGKSLCYQLPAMLRPTPTLVVSPLIALMKDQVDHMPAALRDRVTSINSTLDAADTEARLQALAAGQVKLLYAAPERLRQARFAEALARAHVGLVVVDEAHCVALWGHDFRPDYLFIRSVLAGALRTASVLALTATATPRTAEEIGRALGRPLEVVRGSVVRENLRYEVQALADEEAKLRFTLAHAHGQRGAGIVYVRARARSARIAELLQRDGVAAAAYHAGLEREARAAAQEGFLQGSIRVVVATTAFGMGVDKPDVRWVLLYNYPTSLEEYVQQVGRAGRDGQAATCTLLVTAADAQNVRHFARRDTPTLDELRRVWTALRRASRGRGQALLTPEELARAAALPEGKDPRVHCGVLEHAGLLARDFDGGAAMRFTLLPPPADAPTRMAAVVEGLRRAAEDRVDDLLAFAQSRLCRHRQVALHFGDSCPVPCGRCDVCAPLPARPTAASRPVPALPAQPAAVILKAVATLRRPLGVSGLIACLTGSVTTPPSARSHPAFGCLGAASPHTVRRWVESLLATGHLARQDSADGFPILVLGPHAGEEPPTWPTPRRRAAERPGPCGGRGPAAASRSGDLAIPLDADQQARAEVLRAWRSTQARRQGLPAYVVLPDRALRAVARARPASLAELAAVPGIGPKRLQAWGEELLAALAGVGATAAGGAPGALEGRCTARAPAGDDAGASRAHPAGR
jgi:ATP-dependent DNA helicase RecQ